MPTLNAHPPVIHRGHRIYQGSNEAKTNNLIFANVDKAKSFIDALIEAEATYIPPPKKTPRKRKPKTKFVNLKVA